METIHVMTLRPTRVVPRYEIIFSGFQDPELAKLFTILEPLREDRWVESFELSLVEKVTLPEVFPEQSWLSPMETLQLLLHHNDEMRRMGKNFFPVTTPEGNAVLEVQFSYGKCNGIVYPPDCPIVWTGMSSHRHFRRVV